MYYQREISNGFEKAGAQRSHVTRWPWKHMVDVWTLLHHKGRGAHISRRQVGHWVRRNKGSYRTALIPAQLPLPVWPRTGQLSATWCACRVTETRQFQYTNHDVHTRQFSSDRAPWTLTDQQCYAESSPSVPPALKWEGSSLAGPLWKKG